MEAVCSSEMSADFQQTKQRYIPEDITLILFLFDIYLATLSKSQAIWRRIVG
jgi:hypothetical protein